MALDPDPYRVLGLSRGASLDEVKRAYRRLAKANHPDAAGAVALPRFLAIQAAYERLTGGPATAPPGGPGTPPSRRRPGSPEPDGGDATRRAYGGRPRGRARATGRDRGGPAGAADAAGASTGAGTSGGESTETGAARGKATLGSTSYDGADAGPFEPDWAGASWYGTSSGTYWTINPKEYADPRKHGPEYQARARRAAAARPSAAPGNATAGRRRDRVNGSAADPTPATGSWQESTPTPAAAEPGPVPDTSAPDPARSARRRRPSAFETERDRGDRPVPDPARAAIDLGRSLTDPASGGLRGRMMRAVLGWVPVALGLGWLLGELTGCGRFAATCDPSVGPLTAAGQAIVLAILVLLPEVGAIAAGAALFVLGAAIAASLVLSATGAAADEASRRTALGGLVLVAWLGGLATALVRRARSGSRSAGPVS